MVGFGVKKTVNHCHKCRLICYSVHIYQVHSDKIHTEIKIMQIMLDSPIKVSSKGKLFLLNTSFENICTINQWHQHFSLIHIAG